MFRKDRRPLRSEDRASASKAEIPPEAPPGAARPDAATRDRPSSAPAMVEGAGPSVLSGRYEVGPLLGSGGVSSVFAAKDLLLGREVAVKLFRRDTIAGPDLRLQQIEARLGAALNHYALTTLFDAGVDARDGRDPQIYLVMELVRGSTLRDRLRAGPLEVSEACWLCFDIAEGLDYMHQAGFIHRDVKPANVLISNARSVRPVVAKLADFGIATPIGQPDLSEYTVGTAAYLSPEQVEGEDARPASDVYSLGLVLLEAITGRVAFPGTVEASAFARLDRDPAVPADVPDAIGGLIARMTDRDPAKRVDLYQVAVELQQFLVDDLVARRGVVDGGAPQALDPPVGADPVSAALGAPDAALQTVVRLASTALRSSAALLLTEDGGAATIVATHRIEVPPQGVQLPAALADGSRRWSVEDAAREPAAGASSLLGGRTGLHAALGIALIGHGDRRLGWLIVLDGAPRRYAPDEAALLADYAAVAAHEIELRAAARRALFPDTR